MAKAISALQSLPAKLQQQIGYDALFENYLNTGFSKEVSISQSVLMDISQSIDTALQSGQLTEQQAAELMGVQAEIADVVGDISTTDNSNVDDGVVESSDIGDSIDGIQIIDGKVGGKIPVKEFIELRKSSIKNPDADSMTLGKFTKDSDSYIAKAGKDSTYFDMGDDWGVVQKKYNLSDMKMFEFFNIPALDDIINSGKEIRFSHDPRSFDKGFLVDEWEYIKRTVELTDSNLIKIGDFWYVQ